MARSRETLERILDKWVTQRKEAIKRRDANYEKFVVPAEKDIERLTKKILEIRLGLKKKRK